MGYRWPLQLVGNDGGEWVGEHRSELVDLTAIFAGLVALPAVDSPSSEMWRAALPPNAWFVRQLGARTAHIRVQAAAVSDMVVKLALPFGGPKWRRLTEQVRHSRAHRRYFWAHRLRALGIDTPRPLGFLERAHQPALDRSFVVTEYIFAPSLIEVRDGAVVGMRPSQGPIMDKRALIRDVATLARELHARGFYPRAFGGDSVLVVGDGVLLADPEPMRRGRLARQATVSNLLCLEQDFRRQVTRTDRVRFLETYLRHSAQRAAELRALLHRLEAAARPVFELAESPAG